jgi:hypothetical protein
MKRNPFPLADAKSDPRTAAIVERLVPSLKLIENMDRNHAFPR